MLFLTPYEPSLQSAWDEFIEQSANGTFLHRRSFLEYHGDRFEDASVMVWESGILVSVFPAHRLGLDIFSHKGLTFGGFLIGPNLPEDKQLLIINSILSFYQEKGFTSIAITPIPFFYSDFSKSYDSDLLSLGFESIAEKEIYVINFPFNSMDKAKRKGVRRAQRKKLVIKEGEVTQEFWMGMMLPLYNSKVGKPPVHSWEEIELLSKRHPGKIQMVSVHQEDELLAGLVIFKHPRVVKVQYSAVTENGKDSRAMDILMYYLMNLPDIKFIDLGTVYDGLTGEKLKKLAHWKESFGAKVISLKTYHKTLC